VAHTLKHIGKAKTPMKTTLVAVLRLKNPKQAMAWSAKTRVFLRWLLLFGLSLVAAVAFFDARPPRRNISVSDPWESISAVTGTIEGVITARIATITATPGIMVGIMVRIGTGIGLTAADMTRKPKTFPLCFLNSRN
jgi:hypothetical protein